MKLTSTSNATEMACPYCGLHHDKQCPSVKAIEYHPDGTVKRVEFVTSADYPQKFDPLDFAVT